MNTNVCKCKCVKKNAAIQWNGYHVDTSFSTENQTTYQKCLMGFCFCNVADSEWVFMYISFTCGIEKKYMI